MATGSKNAKSQSLNARVPHEVVEAMTQVKDENESTAQFIVIAIKREIEHRQNNKVKYK